MIGVAKRILDAMPANVCFKYLTHEVLTTFMAVVCAIVNVKPTVPISHDPNLKRILISNFLLTEKPCAVAEPFAQYDIRDTYTLHSKPQNYNCTEEATRPLGGIGNNCKPTEPHFG